MRTSFCRVRMHRSNTAERAIGLAERLAEQLPDERHQSLPLLIIVILSQRLQNIS